MAVPTPRAPAHGRPRDGAVAAGITHDNGEGLSRIVPSLLAQARERGFDERPDADMCFLFDDDVVLSGDELSRLEAILRSDDRIGMASGEPSSETGGRLASSYVRWPLGRAFPRLWDRWWGHLEAPSGDGIVDADAISSAHIGVTRRCVKIVGGYDETYWPGCHEGLDLCARLRLAGFRIVVDRGLPIRQRTSVTMEKVLGPRRHSLGRSTGVLYAATNYP